MRETAFRRRFSLAERTEPFPSLQVESAYELNQGSERVFSPLGAPPISPLSVSGSEVTEESATRIRKGERAQLHERSHRLMQSV